MKYQLNEYGFITNYLVSGRKETDFSSSAADKNQLACEKMMRSEAADHDPVMPAGPVVLGALSSEENVRWSDPAQPSVLGYRAAALPGRTGMGYF